jgi:hypothetical protein
MGGGKLWEDVLVAREIDRVNTTRVNIFKVFPERKAKSS